MSTIIYGVLIGILSLLLIFIFIVMKEMTAKIKYLEKRYTKLLSGSSASNLETIILKRFAEIDMLKESTRAVAESLNAIGDSCQHSYQKSGLVKYDAFDEVGGEVSFALCLLDRDNSGIILNVIHGKDSCFTYVKEINTGKAMTELSEEEKDALDDALKYETLNKNIQLEDI